MNKRLLTILGVLFCVTMVSAQDEEECGIVTNKKALKLLEQEKKARDRKEANLILKEVLTIEENCAFCYYQLGVNAFDKAYEDNTTYTIAEKYFNSLYQLCPEFHSDLYYYLGVIAYSKEDYKSTADLFQKFLDFKIRDDSQAASDYPEKISNVKAILPEIKFFTGFFENPVPFDPVSVTNVCTQANEYLPMISPDNELLFFTRRFYHKPIGELTEREIEEFTMSTRKSIHDNFDAGIKLPPPFNVGPNYGGATISVNNKEIIICACKQEDPKNSYKNCDLYSSKYERVKNMNSGKVEYKWSPLESLGPNVNSKDWEAQPSLSADGKTLFFSSVREHNGQQYDIYYSEKKDDGTWGPAKIVEGISTRNGNEKAPFMHSDSKTLYFAAEVNTEYWGAGGYDIFYTRQNPDGTWSKPKNIGYPINTENDEHGLIVSTDGKLAYYASGMLKGKGGLDIFSFEIPVEARPEKVVLVKGVATDENGAPLTEAKIEITYTNSDEKEEIEVDPDDGKYVAVVNVESGNDAVITVKAPDRTFDSHLIAANSTEPVIKNANLKSEKIEAGKAYTMNDILFATASYELTPQSKFVIDQFIAFLKENPNIKIAIHGHTDDRGKPDENKLLSENRSKEVATYIISKGISSSRISSQGFGQEKPKVPNDNDENRALNRRTEFFIVSK